MGLTCLNVYLNCGKVLICLRGKEPLDMANEKAKRTQTKQIFASTSKTIRPLHRKWYLRTCYISIRLTGNKGHLPTLLCQPVIVWNFFVQQELYILLREEEEKKQSGPLCPHFIAIAIFFLSPILKHSTRDNQFIYY